MKSVVFSEWIRVILTLSDQDPEHFVVTTPENVRNLTYFLFSVCGFSPTVIDV